MKPLKVLAFLLVFVLITLTACSSTPNSLGIIDDTEKEWEKTLGSLLPNDPVPKEIKLDKGDYIVADIKSVRDGDSLTITNIDTSYIEAAEKKSEVEQVIKSNNGTLGVRFISIDTPEITNGKREHFGDKAKIAVDKLLYNGQVYLELDPKALFDNYNRLIAHAYTTEGVSIQKSLLSNGLARTAYLYDDYKYTADYQHAEEEAKTKKLNIHSLDGYVKTDEIAGFDMSVTTGYEWTEPKETPRPEEVVGKMGEIEFSDFFNFDMIGK